MVNWLKVKWFKYEKKNLCKIFYKYNYSNEFREIDVCGKSRGRRSARTPVLKPLFTKPPALSEAKHRDLMSLCSDRAIPVDYHPFYASLKHGKGASDTLNKPDVDADECDIED